METEKRKRVECEKCGCQDLDLNPVVFDSLPAQYSVKCKKCSHEFGFFGDQVIFERGTGAIFWKPK